MDTAHFWTETMQRDRTRIRKPSIVLWDGNTGEPFYMPPGGSPHRYIAKGFHPNPPKDWQPDPARPVLAPNALYIEDAWEPKRVKSEFNKSYEGIVERMRAQGQRI